MRRRGSERSRPASPDLVRLGRQLTESQPRRARAFDALALGQQVDLDFGAAGKAGDADAGPGRPAIGRKVARVDGVHAWVVGFEVGEVDAGVDHVFEPEAEA